MTSGGTYTLVFVSLLEMLKELEITTIYSRHDHPQTKGIHEMVTMTLDNVKATIRTFSPKQHQVIN
jgi:hypothetical protein